MFHFNNLDFHASDAEALSDGFPLPLLHHLHEIGSPGLVYLSVDIGYEVGVGVPDDVVLCLWGKDEKGVVCVQYGLVVGDDESAGVGHEQLILFSDIFVEDDAQE